LAWGRGWIPVADLHPRDLLGRVRDPGVVQDPESHHQVAEVSLGVGQLIKRVLERLPLLAPHRLLASHADQASVGLVLGLHFLDRLRQQWEYLSDDFWKICEYER